MSEINLSDMGETMESEASQVPVLYVDGGKEYVAPDPSKGKRYHSFDEFLLDTFSAEDVAEIKAMAAAYSVAHELTALRMDSGISQKVMAAALGVSQPRISAIESAPNSKANWSVVQKYVQVTRRPFKAVLEDGTVVSFKCPSPVRPRPRRKAAALACA